MPRNEIVPTAKVAAGTAPLSQATKLGNLVFVAGNTGRHPTNGEVSTGIKEQTRYALERISLILEAAGSSLDNGLTNTCYVSNRMTCRVSTGSTPSSSPRTVRRGPPSLSTSATPTTWSKLPARPLSRLGFGPHWDSGLGQRRRIVNNRSTPEPEQGGDFR